MGDGIRTPLEVRLDCARVPPRRAPPSAAEGAEPGGALAAQLNGHPRQVEIRAKAERLNQGRANRAAPAPIRNRGGIALNDDPGLEREADAMGARALSTAPAAAIRSDRGTGPSGAVIQGKFAVEVALGQFDIDDVAASSDAPTTHKETRISAVHIAGRPQGLFVNAEKSHSTAWALYTDQVRNAVLGRPVAAAVGAIADLYADSRNLPGVARAAKLTAVPRARYDAARLEMENLIAIRLDTIPDVRGVDHLQRMAAAYLAYRNVVPLSQVDLGPATGHGEPEVLKTIRPVNDLREGWEDNPAEEGSLRLAGETPAKIRTAMWSLLDKGVIDHFFSIKTTPATTPGMEEGEEGGATRLIAELVVQHLWTLEGAYETAFRAADMDSEESIRGFLLSAGCRGLYQDTIYGKIVRLYDGAPEEKRSTENEDRLMTAGPAGQGQFSAQIVLAPDGRITDLRIGGRAPTALGSDQGSHSTAWLVYVDAVRRVVVGSPFEAAVKDVLGLCDELKTLPGMARVGNLTEKPAYYYAIAQAELVSVRSALESATARVEAVPLLQRLIKAYLGMRNAVPLSQVKGGLADANSEGRNRAKMRYLESGFTEWKLRDARPDHDLDIFRTAFWELYDYKAMSSAMQHNLEPEDAPGITPKEDGGLIAADSVKQHLIAMKSAYPKSFDILKASSPESLNYVLSKMEMARQYRGAVIDRILA